MPAKTTPPPLPRGIRKSSAYEYLGLPLWSVAVGPDFEKGEMRGHAKGVLAIGDMATGVIAVGGLARGVFAIGGLASGVVAFGGLALGGLTLGGLAVGAFALGGGAIGAVAIGGAAVGYYAAGGAAFGTHVLGPLERSPEAIAFFSQWDWLRGLALPRNVRR